MEKLLDWNFNVVILKKGYDWKIISIIDNALIYKKIYQLILSLLLRRI